MEKTAKVRFLPVYLKKLDLTTKVKGCEVIRKPRFRNQLGDGLWPV